MGERVGRPLEEPGEQRGVAAPARRRGGRVRRPHVPPQGDRQHQVGAGAGQQRAPAADPGGGRRRRGPVGPAAGRAGSAASGLLAAVEPWTTTVTSRPRPAGRTGGHGRPGPRTGRGPCPVLPPPPPSPGRRRPRRGGHHGPDGDDPPGLEDRVLGDPVHRGADPRPDGAGPGDERPAHRRQPDGQRQPRPQVVAHAGPPTHGGQGQGAHHRQRHGQDQHMEVGAHPVHHGRRRASRSRSTW